MHLVATTLNSPRTTTYLVIGVAGFLTIAFVIRFWFAWRHNNSVAASMGGFTPTESSLARVHAVLIFVAVFASMGLAIGAVLVPTVRDFLAAVGERAYWLRFAAVPIVTLYLLWLRVRIRRSVRERAARAS
jgi:hypothetical protein